MKKSHLDKVVLEEITNLLKEFDPSMTRLGDPGGVAPSMALAIAGRGKEAAEVNQGMMKATRHLIDKYVMDITYAEAIIVALMDISKTVAFIMAGPVYGVRHKKESWEDSHRQFSLSQPSRTGKAINRGVRDPDPCLTAFKKGQIDSKEGLEWCRDEAGEQNPTYKDEGELEVYYVWDMISENYALFKDLVKAGDWGWAALIGVLLVLDCLAVVFWFLKITKGAAKTIRAAAQAQLKIRKTATNLANAMNKSGNKKMKQEASKIQNRLNQTIQQAGSM